MSESSTETTLLYLVRHGATEANERKPYILQGDGIDLALSPNGERQAREAADFFRGKPIPHVYSSHMLRARQTAGAIAESLGVVNRTVANISECKVGLWEGLDWGTIQQRHPKEAELFLDNPADHPYLGGESYRDVLVRVLPPMQELLNRHRGETVVLVAHNVVNRVLLAHWLGVDLRRAKELRQQNACVNLIAHSHQGTQVVTMNSVFHLSDPPV